MTAIPALREHLAAGRLLLFVGADLPAALTGLPGRAELATGLAARHGLPAGLSLAATAQRVMQDGSRFAFTEYLIRQLDTLGKAPQPIHWLVAGLGAAVVVTTAYDNLLEQAFEQAGRPVNRVVRDSDLAFLDPRRPTLIKLYGDLQQRDSLVVTEDDHYGLWRNREKEGLLDEVRRAMRGSAVLFIGYSLADPDFHLLWREVLDRMGRFALGASAVSPGMPADERQVWKERQVQVSDLEPLDLLAQLATPPGQGGPADQWRSAMPSDETIAQQRKLLATHRATLAILLEQQARHTPAFAPPSIAHGIAEARANVQRIKAALRGWGAPVDDTPNDEDSAPAASPPKTPPPDSVPTVLIVTVTEIEARAVLKQGQDASGQPPVRHFLDDKTYHQLGVIGGAAVFMVQSEMGVGGPSGALLTVQAGIGALSPSAVIMVGIAFGVDPKRQQIGDILIAQQLLGYELQRVGTRADGSPAITVRSDRPSASTRLLDRCRTGALYWDGPALRFGLVLSGEKLVDNQDFREQLRQIAPEAIGGEMEGAGLYAAAQRSKVDWILIKAICDWADGNKGVNKGARQQKAAQNAASFAFHIIGQGGLAGR